MLALNEMLRNSSRWCVRVLSHCVLGRHVCPSLVGSQHVTEHAFGLGLNL